MSASWVGYWMMCMVDFEEMWNGTVKAVVLRCAEVIYLAGDVVRDVVKGRRVE